MLRWAAEKREVEIQDYQGCYSSIGRWNESFGGLAKHQGWKQQERRMNLPDHVTTTLGS